MKNVKLFDNSHNSGSSESEINKILRSNNSLKRFHNQNVEEHNNQFNKKSLKEKSHSKSINKDPLTLKFLNKTVRQLESPKMIQKNNTFKSKYQTPDDKVLNDIQNIFKISLNPFPSCINTKKTSFSNSSNYIIIKNPSSKQIKAIPENILGNLL